MEYRVEQLAAACDVSVDTVRYYQSKGLLDPPERSGRIALYGTEHADRIRAIRRLQGQGLSLAVIKRVLSGSLERGDAALAEAVAQAGSPAPEELLTLDELAARSGIPGPLLRAIEGAGLRIGRVVDGVERFTAADVEIVRVGLKLLEAGIPLTDLLGLATEYDAAARETAERAVELFDAHIRTPIRESSASDRQAADALVAAFREMLPAVSALVAHHFRRVLLQVATEHIERVGDEHEKAASRAESRRLREATWGA